MTAKELSLKYENHEYQYIVKYSDFEYILYAEYDDDGRMKVFIEPRFDDKDIINVDVAFAKTETAIKHIEKELKNVANNIFKSLEKDK